MQAPSSWQGGEGDYSGLASLQDLPEYPRAFVIRRLFVFLGIVVGCACEAPRHDMVAAYANLDAGVCMCCLGCRMRLLAARHQGVTWSPRTLSPRAYPSYVK